MVPAPVAVALGGIDRAQGREGVLRERGPETLSTLREIARVQSVESSNAIEDITAPGDRIREFVSRGARPENHPEEEIAGYRAVLDTINADAASIPFTPSVVEQLHRDLYQFTNTPAGRWKNVENSIQEIRADGVRVVRFQTVSAVQTPAAMKELHEQFAQHPNRAAHHPLLLIGCYVFISSRSTLSATATAASRGCSRCWRSTRPAMRSGATSASTTDGVPATPTTTRCRPPVTAGTRTNTTSNRGCATSSGSSPPPTGEEPRSSAAPVSGRGAKREAIAQFIRGSTAGEFTVADVRRAVPTASDSYIDKTLARLRDEGLIEPVGTGRGAHWRRRP